MVVLVLGLPWFTTQKYSVIGSATFFVPMCQFLAATQWITIDNWDFDQEISDEFSQTHICEAVFATRPVSQKSK